jgi:glucose/arabinose dehydrogenase
VPLRRLAIAVLALSVLVAAGCGGGGGTPSGSTATTSIANTTTVATTTTSAPRTGLALEKVGDFDYPTYVATAPGAKDLLFVVEKPGRIQVLQNGQKQSQPFLDISARVTSTKGEQGLLSVAFDPGYAQNGRFYVNYVNKQGYVEVDRFNRSSTSPLSADPGSLRPLIVIQHPKAPHHYGGQLVFDRQGHLYFGVGDGGVAGDPENDAQRKDSLLGKILRVDPKPGGGYRIPRGNPFVGKPGRDEIFALGLRNPWRSSFDLKTGDLWIGDVGWDHWEEIDHVSLAQAKGANFGWRLFEGPRPCAQCGFKRATPPPRYVPPVHSYPHVGKGEHGFVIVGGYVVRDPGLPSLDGKYIYADNIVGDLRVLDPQTGASTKLGLNVSQPTSFGEGVQGRIYVATLASPGPVYSLTENR